MRNPIHFLLSLALGLLAAAAPLHAQVGQAFPPANIYNASNDGVLGDNVTDRTAALQRAVNHAAAAGLPLFIPDSGKAIVVTGTITVPSGLTIVGTADGTHQPVLWSAANDAGKTWKGTLIRMVGVSPVHSIFVNANGRSNGVTRDNSITFRGLIFDGPTATKNNVPVYGTAGANAWCPGANDNGLGGFIDLMGVDGVVVENCSGYNAVIPVVALANCNHVHIRHGSFFGATCPLIINGPLVDLTIEQARINAGDDDINLGAEQWMTASNTQGDMTDITIRDCQFESTGSHGIKCAVGINGGKLTVTNRTTNSYSYATSGTASIKRLTVERCHLYTGSVGLVTGFTDIDPYDPPTTSGLSSYYSGRGLLEDVTIRNCTVDGVAPYFYADCNARNVLIDGAEVRTANGGSYVDVRASSHTSGSPTIDGLILNRFVSNSGELFAGTLVSNQGGWIRNLKITNSLLIADGSTNSPLIFATEDYGSGNASVNGTGATNVTTHAKYDNILIADSTVLLPHGVIIGAGTSNSRIDRIVLRNTYLGQDNTRSASKLIEADFPVSNVVVDGCVFDGNLSNYAYPTDGSATASAFGLINHTFAGSMNVWIQNSKINNLANTVITVRDGATLNLFQSNTTYSNTATPIQVYTPGSTLATINVTSSGCTCDTGFFLLSASPNYHARYNGNDIEQTLSTINAGTNGDVVRNDGAAGTAHRLYQLIANTWTIQ